MFQLSGFFCGDASDSLTVPETAQRYSVVGMTNTLYEGPMSSVLSVFVSK